MAGAIGFLALAALVGSDTRQGFSFWLESASDVECSIEARAGASVADGCPGNKKQADAAGRGKSPCSSRFYLAFFTLSAQSMSRDHTAKLQTECQRMGGANLAMRTL